MIDFLTFQINFDLKQYLEPGGVFTCESACTDVSETSFMRGKGGNAYDTRL